MRTQVAAVGRSLCLTGLLFWSAVVVSEAQPVSTAIRVLSPPDGAVFEPGALVTVVVEPEGRTPLQEVVIATRGVIQRELAPPFRFTFPAPQELGPATLAIAAEDQKHKKFLKELTYQVETTMNVTRIKVTDPPFFIAAERGISVSGTFADGVTREITRSREITYSSSNTQVATVTPDGLIEAAGNGVATITVTYKNQSTAFPIKVDFKKLTVPLDIEPGKRRKPINLDSRGHVRVAILSTPSFAATTVDPPTVKFGPSGTSPDLDHVQAEDVNGDGRPDLLLRFRIQDAGFQCGQPTATLIGRTLILEDQISGTDSIHVVGKACRGDRDRDRDDQDDDDDEDSDDRDRH